MIALITAAQRKGGGVTVLRTAILYGFSHLGSIVAHANPFALHANMGLGFQSLTEALGQIGGRQTKMIAMQIMRINNLSELTAQVPIVRGDDGLCII
ncbi:MAG: hypothetical protein KKC20_09495 [Proteobacteria bacterium]|nr:hypothetical protein [Pseudomonadota bacterium]